MSLLLQVVDDLLCLGIDGALVAVDALDQFVVVIVLQTVLQGAGVCSRMGQRYADVVHGHEASRCPGVARGAGEVTAGHH